MKKIIFFTITALIVGIISWAFYHMINQGAYDLLQLVGIENFYLQSLVIILLGVGLLLLVGMSGKKIWKKVID